MLLALLLGRELLACASTIDWPELKIHAVVVKNMLANNANHGR